jgi:hypothetical protein
MDTRKIVDYAQDGNAVGVREELYAAIWDRVHAAIESKKQQIAQGLVTQESYEGPDDDEEEDDWDEEDEQIDETLGATLRKYVPGLGKDELKKRYLDADTRTRYTLGKSPENHTDADKKELEMHAKKLRRYGKLVDKHIGEAYEIDEEQLDEISDKAKRDYLSKVPASVTKIQKNAEKEITTNPDQGKGLSNALKGLAKINKRGEMAAKVRQSLKSEAYDDDEDPDVRIADKELKRRGVTLPKVKVDPDKDMARLAKRTPKEKEDD